MKPMAIMPDNLEYHNGIVSSVEIDIYEALKQLNIRAKVMRDPFSD